MIDPREFNTFVESLGFSATASSILIHLNKGPLRLKTLEKLITTSKESGLRKSKDELLKKGMIGTSYLKKNYSPFYFMNRQWQYWRFQAYLRQCGQSTKAKKLKPINEIFNFTPDSIDERENRRIQYRYEGTDNIYKKNSIKPKRDKDAQKTFEKETKEHGDEASNIKAEDGMRLEFGKLLLNNITDIVENLKEGNQASTVLFDIWKDVYGKDAELESKEVEKSLINDYSVTVEGKPENEREIRIYLWLSDLFHILDMYEESLSLYQNALLIAGENVDINSILVDTQISKGHIYLHLNRLPDAAHDFNRTIKHPGNIIHPILCARSYFRLGEVKVYQGDTIGARKCFSQALYSCEKLEKEDGKNLEMIQHIRSDVYRKMGTAYRMDKDLSNCLKYYEMADNINNEYMFRGYVWLLHGWAEYYRAKGYAAMEKDSNGGLLNNQDSHEFFKKSREVCKEAKKESAKIRNINRYAHALLIECEIDRLEFGSQGFTQQKTDEMMDRYKQALDVYLNIYSRWGEANIFISQYLTFHKTEYEIKDNSELLDYAKYICDEMGFGREFALIQKVKKEDSSNYELNPLSLF
mgnify:FL=1